jgi:hypothetical protein
MLASTAVRKMIPVAEVRENAIPAAKPTWFLDRLDREPFALLQSGRTMSQIQAITRHIRQD